MRQKRTEYDRQKKDIEQATEFLQKWQRVITARLTESDKALAAESRILRSIRAATTCLVSAATR